MWSWLSAAHTCSTTGAAESRWELLQGPASPTPPASPGHPPKHTAFSHEFPQPDVHGLAWCWAAVSTRSTSGLRKGHSGGVSSAHPVPRALSFRLRARTAVLQKLPWSFPLLTQVRLCGLRPACGRWDGGQPWTEIKKKKKRNFHCVI